MKRFLHRIIASAIMLIALQITLTAQPVGSQIKTDTSGHISYWNGVDAWIPIAPGLPGQTLKFTAGVPSWVNNPNGITTTAVSNITGNTALSGGNVISDGGAKITAKGVCWSTSPNPTIADNKTIDGGGIGGFTSFIIGLNSNTTYFVRAYATNSFGTAYGNDVNFTTIPTTITDYDGNVYDVIAIGTQVWMKQNLKTTHFKNGSVITYPGTDNNAWFNAWQNNIKTYAWYNNDEPTYKNTYGALYNWHAVNTGNLCPMGWHVPTDAEWTTLTTYLGGAAGDKLKATTLWNSPNTGATNETDFTALPGGMRDLYGTYDGIGDSGFWWSSTEQDSGASWFMGIIGSNAFRNSSYKTIGFSVRCLRD